jgi:Holliday junction DNA helicase RuvB
MQQSRRDTEMEDDSLSQIVPTLNHVVGQTRAVAVLQTAIDSYFYERSKVGVEQAFPHMLLTGPSGTGKTLLCEIVANELCCNLHSELAQNIRTPEHVHGSLMMLEPGDVLFYDEIHELPQKAAVTLYRALEERKLFLGKHHVIKLPPFCLIGATTHEHLLATSCRDRFRILLRLCHYSDDEMFQLLRQRAKRLGWSIEDDATRQVASKSRGVPRLGVRLLESTKRTASADGTDTMTVDHIKRMCDIEQIDPLGLDAIEQKYLRILREVNGPVRLNVIATHLGLPRRSIEMLEADFVRLGLITKSDKGRLLTPKGIEHLAESD